MSSLMRDTRDSLRAVRRAPAFALGAVITIAVTVGATTAVFSVVHAVLLRQLPYGDVERVFWIWSDQPGRDRTPFNVPDFLDYRDSTRSLAGLAGFFAFSANLTDEAAAERVQGLRATGNFFDIIGARAGAGRLLQPGDEPAGADRVVVLTDPFWRRRFGGDPAIVGGSIRLNGEEYAVVGVLAPGFVLPVRDVEFVVPFAAERDPRREARNSLNFVIAAGRLADGISAEQAAGELNAIAATLQKQFPVENARKRGVRLVGIIEGIAGPFRTTLMTLMAAVGAVLLIACANLANLMLTRAAARRRALAVQLALGASRAAIVRQVLVEALVLGLSGGVLGVLLAQWATAALVALAPTALPRAGEIRLDLVVLTFSLLVSLLTSVLFGVVPALMSARVDVRDALQGGGRGATGGGQRIRGALVASEVALAVVLLVVMVMLGRSFANVQAVAPGFDAAGVLSARLTLPGSRFDHRDRIVTFQQELARQVSSAPAVTATGAISLLPLSGLLSRVPFTVDGRPVERERVPAAQYRMVSPGYFEAARIPLKRGRTFSERDTATTSPVAVVSEELARQWLDGIDPIGARLLVDDNDSAPRPVEIVGVVGNVRQVALDGAPTWDLYITYSQIPHDNVGLAAGNMFWIVRTEADPMTLAAGFSGAVRRIDPEVAASPIRPFADYLSDAMAPRQFSLALMAGFAVVALALAIAGIYAVVTYAVSQRARELDIRVALGASRTAIVGLVMSHGLRFVVIGLTLGTAIAAGVTRLIASLLFGVTSSDLTVFGLVIAVVATASALACAVPGARAGRPAAILLNAE
jgi:putative ABC transport system permease protein